MRNYMEKHPYWTLISVIAAAFFLWLIFAVWPQGLVDLIGRKKIFLNAILQRDHFGWPVFSGRQWIYPDLWADEKMLTWLTAPFIFWVDISVS